MVNNSNRRIARNAVVMYLRMFVTIIVSLYTSRLVLQALGASDYGIFALVGGVVTLFSFLNSAIGGATSRFINYAMGTKDVAYLNNTFRSALFTHLLIALGILLLSETIGLWMLTNKLVIPAGRLFAAHIVMQCSILSMCLGVLQGPFSACIIAHEKMDIYAYVEIINVVLKLVIVYLLLVVNFDKLIIYALMVCAVSILIMGIYVWYAARQFKEVIFKPLYRKDLFLPMLSYTGWRFFSCFTDNASAQGRNMILNMFWGTVLNAAAGLATTVQSVVSGFAYNVMVAFRPQIVMNYAEGNIPRMQSLMEEAFMLTNILFMFVGIPIFIECEYLLNLWLVEVPEFTVPFVRITLIAALISNCYGFEGTIIGATGKIKYSQLCIGVLNIFTLLVTYVMLKKGFGPEWTYLPMIPIYAFIFFFNFFMIKYYIPSISLKKLLINGFIKDLLMMVICLISAWIVCRLMEQSFLRLVINTMMNTMLIGLCGYYLILPESFKKEFILKVKSTFLRK